MAPASRISLLRWLGTLIGTALLAGLAWYFGPLLPLLEEPLARVVVVLAMLLVWAVGNLLIDLMRMRREQRLSRGVVGGASVEEASAVADKLSAALALLRQQRGRGTLYEQPWYVIIGPPGAGKTTALLNAGLRFPLADKLGQGAVAGVGGTRLCDWWFTDDAVMIDTAGRYTTQDSDAVVDRAGWEAFLDLLRTTRPRQPLNGVIVAIALSDIAAASDVERAGHARAISARLQELETRLGVRLPVYAVFTKSDLIAGFTEYFDDLDRDARNQVWGTTFARGETAAQAFAPAFSALVERLNSRLFNRLQAERSAERRALIAGFPAQVASLAAPLQAFLRQAFADVAPQPMLRGAYMTSGTQEGTPIDRLTGALSRSFGLDQRRAASLKPEHGRSYFLGDLLTRVVFGEAMLLTDNPAARRRGRLLRAISIGVAVLVVLAAGAGLWTIRGHGLSEIDAMAQALDGYERQASALPLDPVADADLERLVPLLDQARALPHGVDSPASPASDWMLGMDQRGRLQSAARAVYRHALERTLLPRLLWRLEAQMRGNLTRPEFLYEATRIYLMLGNQGPLDPDIVREWMQADWDVAYPGVANAKLREALARHLVALLADPLPQVTLDGALVVQARATFGKVPLAQRVYARIKPSVAAQKLAPWRPSEAVGALGARLFVRASGKRLTDGIPGFFTLPGFYDVLLPSVGPAARSVASESWVLGVATAPDPAVAQALEHDVVALYVADYIEAWDGMLSDLNVVPLRSLTQAAQDLLILSSAQSPMRNLLASAARQVTLSVPPGTQQAAPSVRNAAPSRFQSVLGQGSVATGPATTGGAARGIEVDTKFKALRDLVGDGPGAPIDQPLQAMYDLQQLLAKMAAAPIGTAFPALAPANDPAIALRTEAMRQPQPLQRWLASVATGTIGLRTGGARQQIVAAYNAQGGPGQVCALVTKGHYPFDRTATSDASLEDFARLFAPGGLLDGFFNTQLKPYVDTSGKIWKPQALDGAASPVSADDAAQFQRAAALRDLFFAGGVTVPALRVDITPVSVDRGTRLAAIQIDGTVIPASNAAPRAAQISWPGPRDVQGSQFAFDPAPAGQLLPAPDQGPWAMFKLFDHGKLQPTTSPERSTFTLRMGERQAIFDIRAGTPQAPMGATIFQDFRCPAVQ